MPQCSKCDHWFDTGSLARMCSCIEYEVNDDGCKTSSWGDDIDSAAELYAERYDEAEGDLLKVDHMDIYIREKGTDAWHKMRLTAEPSVNYYATTIVKGD